ncbi:hypothetical protein LJC24_01785 [Desulfococcaceae bacterium OttesenSCG-928-F15]|nr:hypothetical protein [Desulfococcaceae bacterium OttesenSCG-928-F15]
MNEKTKNLYHYTTGKKLSAILQSGEILPAVSLATSLEKALVWCSTREDWEPSVACRKSLFDGGPHYRSMDEIRRSEGGLARIRIKESIRTFTWEQCKGISHISARQEQMFSDFIKECGANPEDWRVSFTAIPSNLWISVEVQYPENPRWARHPIYHKEDLRDLLLQIKKSIPVMNAVERKVSLKRLESLQERYANLGKPDN